MVRSLLLFFVSHRLLAIARFELHLLAVRLRNVFTLQRRRIDALLATRTGPRFLNLGSGPRGRADDTWVNVDGFPDRHVHFLIDFLRPLPFGDHSFDGVFCEHVLEHFTEEDGERLLREVCRILRPGACVRIIVPDGERLMRCYFDAPAELVSRRGSDLKLLPMSAVNSYFRQRYEHQFLYDWPTLHAVLARAGFVDPTRIAFGTAGRCQALVLDDPKYEWESLYVEAVKS